MTMQATPQPPAIEWAVAGISRSAADGRYVQRFVGPTLAADTYTRTVQGGGSVPALINPNGPVIGNVPADAAAAVIAASQGGIFGTQARVLRAGANGSVIVARFNGTYQAPTGVLIAQNCGGFEVRGYDPDSANVLQGAQIFGQTRETWSAAGQGMGLVFQVKGVGDTSLRNAISLDAASAGTILELRMMPATGRIIPATTGQLRNPANTATLVEWNATGLGFFGVAPIARPTIVGARGGNAAVASIAAQLALLGLVIDGTTP